MAQALLLLSIAIAIPSLFNCPLAQAAESDSNANRKDPVLIYRKAGASEEQEAKIRQLAHEYEKEGTVRFERLHNLFKQMKDLSFESDLDEKKILSLQDEINTLQNALNTDRIKLMLKIRSSLSREQKTKLVELLKERELQRPTAKSPQEPAGKGAL